jgi:hypothetical protein
MDESKENGGQRSESLSTLFVDGGKIIATFAVGAASYFGSPLSMVLHDHWFTFALGGALVASLYVIVRRETTGAALRGGDGLVRAVAKREQLSKGAILAALRRAKSIDMVGFNLRSPWLKPRSELDEILVDRLKRESDLRVRIIIADPECESLVERDERETGSNTGRLPGEGNAVKNYLGELRKRDGGSAVAVRLVDAGLISCSLIIADQRIFATWYLTFRGGSQSPTLEIFGRTSAFFRAFRHEFDTLWERGRPMADGQSESA